jgi:hypothetical protein
MKNLNKWLLFTLTVGVTTYIATDLIGVEPVVFLPDWLFRTVGLSMGFGAGLICSEYK